MVSGAFVFLFELMVALPIFNFFLFELSLAALRRQQPGLHRPFRAIGYPLLPALRQRAARACIRTGFTFTDSSKIGYLIMEQAPRASKN